MFLDWKGPTEGGEVAAYRVQRRQRDTGDWLDVGMSVDSEITLNGQDAGIEFEYGDGPPSNIARAVLQPDR